MTSDTCPAGCDLRGAEIPAQSRSLYREGATHYSRVIGVEFRGVYDGVAAWLCPDCGARWHRFPAGDPYHDRIRAAVEPFVSAGIGEAS